jgi:autotransporter-associated beta strand protein
VTGTTARSITGNAGATRLTAGSGSGYNLIVHQHLTGGLTISAVIGNNGANAVSLVKSGASALTLSGINTYTGNTYINSGSLTMGSTNLFANSPTIFIGDSATLNLSSGVNSVFTLASNQSIQGTGATGTINIGNTLTNGVVTAGGNTISTSGALTLQRLEVRGANNEMTGGNITSGVAGTRRGLLVGNISAGTFTISGGTLTSIGGDTAHADVIGTTNATSGTFNITGGNYVNTGTLSFGIGATGHPGGTLNLNSGSATIGTLVFNSNTVGGQGIVNLNGGTLTLSTITSTSGGTRQFNFNGGQFVANGSVTFDNTLTLNVQNGGALLDTNGNSVAISGNLLNNGTGGLVKTGGGTLTLSGANTYTGDTVIHAGTLQLGAAGSFANSERIIVGDATAVDAVLDLTSKTTFGIGASQTLMGNGRLLLGTGTDLSIDGTFSPGNSTGLIEIDGGDTVNLFGTTVMEVWGLNRGDAVDGYDAVDVFNDATLDFADGALELNFDQTFANTTTFSLFTAFDSEDFSTLTGNFLTITMVGDEYDDLVFAFNAGIWSTNVGANSQSMTFSQTTGQLVVVPEPSTMLLGGLGLLGLLVYHRSRRARPA